MQSNILPLLDYNVKRELKIFLSTMKEKNGEKKHLAHCVKSGCQLTGAIVVVAISPWSLYCIFFWVGCKTIPLLKNNF